jgi:hypothetical protein
MNIPVVIAIMAFVILDMAVLFWVFKRQINKTGRDDS